MKKFHLASLFILIIFMNGCSKDFLKRYDVRIIGTWRISHVSRVGLGGTTSTLPFTEGIFTFFANGSLDYTNSKNELFKGSWDIVKKVQGERSFRSLQITAVDFTNEQVLSQYYDDMNFAGTNHFKATINAGFHSFVTHFRR